MNKPENLVECWNDDERMNFLFSDFPANKETNPTHWKTKFDFWTTLILDLYRNNDDIVLNYNAIGKWVERKGQKPLGLHLIWTEMIAQKQLIPADYYTNDLARNFTWYGWGVNTFVRKPVTWLADKLLSPISRHNGFNSSQSQDFVNTDIIKIKSNMLFYLLLEIEEKVTLHKNMFLVMHEKLLNSFGKDEKSLDLLLLCLEQQKRVSVYLSKSDTDSDKTMGRKYVKFSKYPDVFVEKVTEVDVGILKLKQSEIFLSHKITALYKNQTKLHENAQKCTHSGQKTKAKSALRQKHRTSVLIEKKEKSLENIQLLLEKIELCETDQLIVKAFEAGKMALKDTIKNMSIDSVENTMEELNSLIEENQEMSDIIATPLSANDMSTEDLEKELADLLKESEAKSETHDVNDLNNAMAALNSVSSEIKKLDLPDTPSTPIKKVQPLSELA